jgi:hypothetical protein
VDVLKFQTIVRRTALATTVYINEMRIATHAETKRPTEALVAWQALIESTKTAGTYRLLACGCQRQRCDELRRGIEVRLEDRAVVWRIIDSESTLLYSFDPRHYVASIADEVARINGIIAGSRGRRFTFQPPENAHVFGLPRTTKQDLALYAGRSLAWVAACSIMAFVAVRIATAL